MTSRLLIAPLSTLALAISLHFILAASAGVIDNMILARVGSIELAISGAATRYFWLTLIIVNGFCVGTSILLNQTFGVSDKQGFRAFNTIGFIITLVAVLLTAFTMWFFEGHLLAFLLDGYIVQDPNTGRYFKLTIALFFVSSISLYLDNILRVLGMQNLATGSYAVEITINVVMSIILTFGMFGFPRFGLFGPIISSILVRLSRTAFILQKLYGNEWFMFCAVNWGHAIKTMRAVTPVVLTNATWIVGLFFVQWAISGLGTTALMGLTLYLVLEMFLLSGMSGVTAALAIRVGRASGRGNLTIIKKYTNAAFIICSFLSLLVIIFTILLAKNIDVIFFGLNPKIYVELEKLMYVLGFGVVLRSYVALLNAGVLRAIGDVKFCFYVEIITLWLIMLPFLLYVVSIETVPLYLVFMVALTDDLVKIAVFLLRYKSMMSQNSIEKFLET